MCCEISFDFFIARYKSLNVLIRSLFKKIELIKKKRFFRKENGSHTIPLSAKKLNCQLAIDLSRSPIWDA